MAGEGSLAIAERYRARKLEPELPAPSRTARREGFNFLGSLGRGADNEAPEIQGIDQVSIDEPTLEVNPH